MRIIFMGTPDFAVAGLSSLVASSHEVVLVVTQPDRQKGRGKKLEQSPVKSYALANQIPVFQPENVNTPEAVAVLKAQEADILVVIAYGQILKAPLLSMAPFGAVNVHASLLPTLRGAAPLQWAIISGHPKTGLTLMQMNRGLDTGDMLFSLEVPLDEKITYGMLHDSLMASTKTFLPTSLSKIQQGDYKATPQDEALASYAPLLTAQTGRIDFSEDAHKIAALMRGLDPKPGAFFMWRGQKYKLFSPSIAKEKADEVPGQVMRMDKEGLFVVCADGSLLKIKEIQAPGKKRMPVSAYIQGNETFAGRNLIRDEKHE